eukprot:TRINITY_DN58235_c0_g1_i1.p1 TRINITY_DN58235_c0_g1~~TRINITY_DN58235_c0_g1_i1.p1  ORF type:complete len:131 (+),score=11.46 TRINITY_DN58235_c0_g1_i1:23-415(+)
MFIWFCFFIFCFLGFFFQAESGIRDAQESRGLGDVYKRQGLLKWQYDNTNLGWCFWGGCRSLSGRFLNLENPASAAVPLVFDSITGLWADGGGHVYEGVLCTVGSTTPVIETTIIPVSYTHLTLPTKRIV